MTTIQNILCVIDPTAEQQYALKRATWFAKRMDARLRVLHCHYDQLLQGHPLIDQNILDQSKTQLMAEQEQRLADLVEPIKAKGVRCDHEVVWDHPLDAGIAHYAIQKEVDIIFKDTHQHPVLGFGRLTNTDWCLMRSSPMPLWFVKLHELPPHVQLVAAIDPFNLDDKHAELDKTILSLARDIAYNDEVELHAFHAVDFLSRPSDVHLSDEQTESQIIESTRQTIFEVARTANVPAENTHVVAGAPHVQLPLFAAKLDATAVVMGAVSRNRLKRLFIGATAELALDRLHCDLIVVKPNWAESMLLDRTD